VIVDDFIQAPAVVVGGGIAGLATALSLDACVLVANGPIGEGSSRLAQGGIAAAIGRDDTPALHAADTIRVGAGLCEPDIVTLVTAAAASRITWLREFGTTFDLGADGAPLLGREAGHGRHRIVHAGGDRTGAAVMRALRAATLQRPDIRRLEGFELIVELRDDRRGIAGGVVRALLDPVASIRFEGNLRGARRSTWCCATTPTRFNPVPAPRRRADCCSRSPQ